MPFETPLDSSSIIDIESSMKPKFSIRIACQIIGALRAKSAVARTRLKGARKQSLAAPSNIGNYIKLFALLITGIYMKYAEYTN